MDTPASSPLDQLAEQAHHLYMESIAPAFCPDMGCPAVTPWSQLSSRQRTLWRAFVFAIISVSVSDCIDIPGHDPSRAKAALATYRNLSQGAPDVPTLAQS